MKNKLIIVILFVFLISLSVHLHASAAALSETALSPGLNVISASAEMVVSAVSGNSVIFTSEDFSEAYMLGDDFSITVVSLPDATDGILKSGNTSVSEGQTFNEKSVSTLRFAPSDECTEAAAVFNFNGLYEVPCSIRFTETVNFAPTSEECLETWTSTDIVCAGYLRATDPENDAITYELFSPPENGTVSISGDGKYVYTPYAGARGTDSFTYRAKDEFGNYSSASTVRVTVEKSGSTLVFADMNDSPSYAAAISVVSDGIMDAREADGEYLFDPEEKISRAEFLVCAMDAFGAENVPEIKYTSFADDSDILPEHKGYVQAASSLGIISGTDGTGLSYFEPDRNITVEEAAVILNRIIGLQSDGDECAVYGNVSEWAKDDVTALCGAGICDPYTDFSAELDRAACAGIICAAQRFLD